ncbi:Asp-tRNA(Asn)/Glu-tRNA(Gln) amidotransferase subunit GatC [Melissococcus plutonius]|uniref:Aspartyl/glutamyl-tRNA(Asn/Gln) amidotransferase subunit C n=2 Tax=Melissococcus plutonius TaxID=33970 RepID=F3Y9F2_MELPT|nr:Asp-tRNA(Asn)/Glu-tRNA(Gln) amidotransferase subunit GatC [Melissococcus plutonius]BAL62482.1 aspartyl-tRNA(Asn) amidotransferase subunit C/ glutamyl-tRNA(Gln) amidotransferase subunit C [Melissococcus plutonius DAT561]AIM24686.1 aspartyl/glutamyl-tRNA(Asn/Gln) amidotransferase subunit C [Melissococcus plutonius S1]KMT24790.1 aspartyl/glutamyl-tRNA(Asn/Gln) amidotransferase subunit C [Melissococcus plutonius]KMT26427.1 aspartyl/glutamyl-tRNA(Asn/Gln) amidotransferase subunit C [Melissococcus
MVNSEEKIKKIAELSKLSFSPDELKSFTSQLEKIINMVEELEEVDTTGVPFTANIIEGINVLREDVSEKGTPREELLRNAPDAENGYIKVPTMIDNGEAGA